MTPTLHPIIAFLQAKLASDVGPIFPNNAQGWVSLIVSVVVLLGAIETIRYQLHVKPVEKDLAELGKKVDRMHIDHERTKEQVSGLKDLIAAGQRDTITAILAMGKQQTEATHKVELRVAELSTAINIAEAITRGFNGFGEQMRELLKARQGGDGAS